VSYTYSQVTCIGEFGGTHPKHDTIHIGNQQLCRSDRVKYLGCWVRSQKHEGDPLKLCWQILRFIH